MVSEKIENLLNDQLNKELFSGYLYLSIEAYFESINLPGFAHWFRVQAQEERDHALLFFEFINRVNGRVKLMPIEGPKVEFASIMEALEASLAHEQFVTNSINNIVEAARQEKDYKTDSFLKWFIDEQVEEEENAENNIRRYERVENDGKGILMLDTEFAARVYTPAPGLNASGAQA
jgi:ferritin